MLWNGQSSANGDAGSGNGAQYGYGSQDGDGCGDGDPAGYGMPWTIPAGHGMFPVELPIFLAHPSPVGRSHIQRTVLAAADVAKIAGHPEVAWELISR